MLYPVVIHKDIDSDYGATVPDLPGCVSAGETYEEALCMVKEAIELHIEGMLEDGENLPNPSAIEKLQSAKEHQGGVWALVDKDTEALAIPHSLRADFTSRNQRRTWKGGQAGRFDGARERPCLKTSLRLSDLTQGAL